MITANDENTPFYRNDGEPLKPIAKIHVTRQKLYEKVCQEDEKCKTTEWSEWSSCNCAVGVYKTRTRQLQNPENEDYCNQNSPVELEETATCSMEECEEAVSRCFMYSRIN